MLLHISLLRSNIDKHEEVSERFIHLSFYVLLLNDVGGGLNKLILRIRPNLRCVVGRWKQHSYQARLILRSREMHGHNYLSLVRVQVDRARLHSVIHGVLVAHKQVLIAAQNLDASGLL